MNNLVRVTQQGRQPLVVLVDTSLEIGRDCDGLLLDDEQVSRKHLRLDFDGRHVTATDLGSSNGTLLDGQPMASTSVLLPGSTLTVGGTTISLHAAASAVAPAPDEMSVKRGRATVAGVASPAPSPGAVRPVQTSTGGARATSIDSLAEELTTRPPTLNPAASADGTITIMFSDIESSTERALALGDIEWMEVLREHNQIFERRVASYGGTIIKNQGDGYMVTFGSARRAILCAATVQRDLHSWSLEHPDRAVRVRMGCHTGEVIHDGGDVFGRHVIIAARVANLANGAQILVSSIAKAITEARGDLSYGPGTPVDLKGVDGDHVVYALDWERAPDS